MSAAARLRAALGLAGSALQPEPLDFTQLPALSLRRPSRNPIARALAHILIRLLVLAPMPQHLQVWAALFPLSVLVPLIEVEADPGPNTSYADGPALGDEGISIGSAALARGPALGYDWGSRPFDPRVEARAGLANAKYDAQRALGPSGGNPPDCGYDKLSPSAHLSPLPYDVPRAQASNSLRAGPIVRGYQYDGTLPSSQFRRKTASREYDRSPERWCSSLDISSPGAPFHSALYFAKARFYDPTTARFTSQDSFLGNLDNPPSLHRYFYANANPTRYIDPTGHVVRQMVDEAQGKGIAGDYSGSSLGWIANAAYAGYVESQYQVLNLISFGALNRQDKLVDKNLAGEISDTQYHQRTAVNVALSAGQAAVTLGTGGAAGAPVAATTAFVRGAGGGVAAQGLTDIVEIYGTGTKTLDDVNALDYAFAAGLGGIAGYAGNRELAKEATRAASAAKPAVVVESAPPPTPTQDAVDSLRMVDQPLAPPKQPASSGGLAGPTGGFGRYVDAERAALTPSRTGVAAFPTEVEFTPSTGRSYKVFQRGDIDWEHVRTAGAADYVGSTNAEAARAGLRPQLPDGSFATLHHSQQSARGPWFEASTRYHNIRTARQGPLHPYGGQPHPDFPLGRGPGSLRESFQTIEGPEYWTWREANR